ncbi:MAG: hypothetical protein HY721_11155 [Planctomycetes bacterium]|nr:hypothetical protein [Planctomycetota bacterium]
MPHLRSAVLAGGAGWLAALTCFPLLGQSDACGEAPEIRDGSFRGTTAGATADGSASCGEAATSPDVWLRYTASRRGLLVASTCGSGWDTVLSIHAACPGTMENQLACNDDACGTQSRAAIRIEPGETYWIRIGAFSGLRREFLLTVASREVAGDGRPDPALVDLEDMQAVGREDGEVACALASTICNLGDAPVDWFGNPDPRHPMLVFNLYRLWNGRFEQIGGSGVKHGCGAAQHSRCKTTCFPNAENTRLGPGCADTYDTAINAWQEHLGPRGEVDPWSGEFRFEGSHVEAHRGSTHGPLDHRLRVRESDLDGAIYPGARYFCEGLVVVQADADRGNNVAWKEVEVLGGPGSWAFRLLESPARGGPAVNALEGARLTVLPQGAAREGHCVLAARATENPGGTWRYEYALLNLDLRRAVSSFRLAVPASATLADIETRGPPALEEDEGDRQWTGERDGASLLWFVEPDAAEAGANPLRWGTLRNFRFDAGQPPAEAEAVLGLSEPGLPAELRALTIAPSPAGGDRFKRGDAEGDGTVDISDAVSLLGYLFHGGSPPPCLDAADADDSGGLELLDVVRILGWLYLGSREPAPPGPLACGLDSTPANPPIPACLYMPERC